jgi:tRNA threonylcarbamoyladenosine biosynthesis protein TsaB
LTILALDTATAWGSVALLSRGEPLGEVRLRTPDAHSARILPSVEFLLGSLGLTPMDVEGYAVAAGPGSFTGIRVGLATVQGLALGAARPCLGISTLDALAAKAAGAAANVVAMIDAYRDEVYAAVYDAAGLRLRPAAAVRPERLLEGVADGAAFVGDGAAKYAALIRELCPRASFPVRSPFLAASIGRLAAPRFLAGEGQRPEALRPCYLREADVRRPAP